MLSASRVSDLGGPLIAGVKVYAVASPIGLFALPLLGPFFHLGFGAAAIVLLFWIAAYVAGAARVLWRGYTLVNKRDITWGPALWAFALYIAPPFLLFAGVYLFSVIVAGIASEQHVAAFAYGTALLLALYLGAIAATVRGMRGSLAGGALRLLAGEVSVATISFAALCLASPEFRLRGSWEMSLDGAKREWVDARDARGMGAHERLTIDVTIVVREDGHFVYQFACEDRTTAGFRTWANTHEWRGFRMNEEPRQPGTYHVHVTCEAFGVEPATRRQLTVGVVPWSAGSAVKRLTVDLDPDMPMSRSGG